MADEKKAAKQYDSIIDAMLDEREPDWNELELADAKKSGDEWMDRAHAEVDTDFEDDIAESASRHTPIWGPKSGHAEYEDRIAEKEAAAPRIHSVQANRYMDDFKSKEGDNDSLMDEVTESIEKAYSGSNLAPNSAEKKAISDAQAQKYVRDLLNQGVAPAKIAKMIEKMAELELFNHQMATDYLQRNAGLMGLAYLEPNTFMEKNSPKYERTASAKTAGKFKLYTGPTIVKQTADRLRKAGINVTVEGTEHIHFLADGDRDSVTLKLREILGPQWGVKGLQQINDEPSNANVNEREASSNACVAQKKAWDNAGIKPQAKSVKQVSACAGCTYFKKNASDKSCNLYHLPIIANTTELTQIVNHLTPGVPSKQKHAALVQIANGDGKRAQAATTILAQTNLIKTADAKVSNQSKRAAYTFHDERETTQKFSSEHIERMHEKGVTLARIAGWAEEKGFPDTDVSFAFRGFVQNLKKNASGKIVLAKDDVAYLNHIGIRNQAFSGAAKCASCPAHFNREAREQEPVNMRVDQKFASRTAEVVRGMQAEEKEITITSAKVRTLHQAGHSVEKIYIGVANKVGSVQAKRIIAGFIEDIKKQPGKLPVNASDRAFLEGKLGFKPEQIRMLNPDRRPVTQVVASVPDDVNVMSYPGMEKHAGEKKHVDGHSILAEYDLTGSHEMQDIDVSGPKREEIETNSTFKVDLD